MRSDRWSEECDIGRVRPKQRAESVDHRCDVGRVAVADSPGASAVGDVLAHMVEQGLERLIALPVLADRDGVATHCYEVPWGMLGDPNRDETGPASAYQRASVVDHCVQVHLCHPCLDQPMQRIEVNAGIDGLGRVKRDKARADAEGSAVVHYHRGWSPLGRLLRSLEGP